MNTRRLFLRQVMLLVLVAIMMACTQAPPPQTSATPTMPSSTSTVLTTPQPTATATPIPPLLGPVPQHCPLGPTPRMIFPDVGPGIGSFPVWAFGFGGPHATLRISPHDTYTPYGWIWKIIWRVSTHYTYPVRLDGGNLRTGTPLWFQVGDQDPSTSPVLDPRPKEQHALFPTDTIGWGSYLYIPAAGCYYLEADWSGGHWRITFAAGRL